MSKYIYRIIKKRDQGYLHIQRMKNSFWSALTKDWESLDCYDTLEICETYIKNRIAQEKEPLITVIKEFF